MSLIVTPGQLKVRAEFYHQLGAMLTAGLPLINTLESLLKSPPSYSFRRPISSLIQSLEQGETFSEALQGLGFWAPSFDIALIEAGEKSGRLDSCCKLLASYYSERAQLAQDMIGYLMYPVFLFHFAILIIPFPQLFLSGDIGAYLSQVLGVLIPVYLIVFLFIWASQARRSDLWRSFTERLCRMVPLLGTARRSLALARLSAALEALINAGVSIINAWELAAAASGSPALRRTVFAWRERVEYGGERPSEVVNESREFPELFANLYSTGETTGRLDESLRRIHDYYQEEGSRKLKMLSEWFPRLVYLGIALMIARHVIGFWSNYFNNISNVLN